MRGHPPGWRVDPAPDGRGATPDQKPPLIPRSGSFRTFLLALLVVNLVVSFATGRPQERPQVPCQPFFVEQLEAGNVEQISSRADSTEGELERAADSGAAKPSRSSRFRRRSRRSSTTKG
jgi:cell division protease FtsH